MQVYVGQFRYINEGETEVFLATTEDKIKELLTQQMLVYIDWTDDFVLPPQQNYDALTQIGYNNEWFEVTYDTQQVHSDGHILKHVMETI
tara:strand:- start:617 stop:886 length:270 start_codon:yes stop_codon:yes gene_type:complete